MSSEGQGVRRLPRLFDSHLSLNQVPVPVKEDRTREQKRAIFSYNIHLGLISQHLIHLRQPEAKLPLSDIYRPPCTAVTTVHTSPLQSAAAPARRAEKTLL